MLKHSIDYILNDYMDMPVLEREQPPEEIIPAENLISNEHVKFSGSSLYITFLESDWRWKSQAKAWALVEKKGTENCAKTSKENAGSYKTSQKAKIHGSPS